MSKFTRNAIKMSVAAFMIFSCFGTAQAVIADEPDPVVVFEEDFSLFPAIVPWEGYRYAAFTKDEKMKDEFFHTPGWKGWYITYGMDAGCAHFEYDSESDTGYLQTPPIELSADGGKVTITFEYRRNPVSSSNPPVGDRVHVQLRDRTGGKDNAITGIFTNNVEVGNDWTKCSTTLVGGTADCSIRIWGGSYPGDIRNLKILQVRPQIDVPVADPFTDFTGDSFTAHWREVKGAEHYLLSLFSLGDSGTRSYVFTDKEIKGTEFKATDLDPAVVYYYTVKAVGNGLTSKESVAVRCFGVPRPAALSISDISEEGFTVSWDAPYNANRYQLETTLEHTAAKNGRYYILDEDFLGTPAQDSTPDNPVRASSGYLDGYINRANYSVKNPLFAADCIGLDNTYASMGSYGELDGPTMDLSANGGEVTVEMRVRAVNAASLSLYMMNERERENQFTSDIIADRIELWNEDSRQEPLSDKWTNRTFTLRGGNEASYIAIQAYGYGAAVQIDRLAIYQELKTGDIVRVPYRSIVTDDCTARVETGGESFDGTVNQFTTVLRAAYVPAENEEGDVVSSPWSEVAAVRLPTPAGIASAVASQFGVTVNGGAISVTNPDQLSLKVVTPAGVTVFASDDRQFTTPVLPAGIYIVAGGAKAVKVAF